MSCEPAHRHIRITIALSAAVLMFAPPAQAEEWAVSAPGVWNDPLNWSPQSVPNGPGASASIIDVDEGGFLSSGGTFNLDVPVTIGNLSVDMGLGGPSLFFAGNALTLDNNGAAATIFTDGSLACHFTMDIVLMDDLVTEWRASNGEITGAISGDHGITQDAVGGIPRLKLFGNNTYTGQTIARNGWISIRTIAGLGSNAAGTTVEAGGRLVTENLNPTVYSGEPLTIMDGGRLMMRTGSDWAEQITIDNGALVGPFFDDEEATISAAITGSGPLTRESADSNFTTDPTRESILYLTSANNDYTGGTIIDSGVLAVSSDANLGTAGAGITFDNAGFSEGPAALLTTADATIDRDITLLDAGWLRAADGTTGSYTGTIAGSQPLQVGFLQWTGTVELLGDSAYTGGTTIVAGTLRVNNASGTGTGSGNVTVQQDATLGGTGNIAGGVIVETGGMVAPGSSTGSLSVGAVTFNADSVCRIELGGTAAGAFDQLIVANAAALNGTLDVSVLPTYTPMNGDSFDVITAGSATGTFAVENLPAGFELDYQPGLVRVTAVNVSAPCPEDLTDPADGVVDVFDLFVLLNNWGTAGAGADLAAPVDIVDVFDLFELLGAWGDCP